MFVKGSGRACRAIVAVALLLGLVGVLGSGPASARGAGNPGNGSSAGAGHVGGGAPGHGPKERSTAGGTSAPGGIGAGASTHGAKGGSTSGGDAGVPGPKGGRRGPADPSGSTTCSVHAVVTFEPPLRASAGASSSARLDAQLTHCSPVAGRSRTTGHVSAAFGAVPANICASAAITLPAIASPGLTVRWTPSSRAKSVVTAPAGAASTVTDGHGKTGLQIAYTGVTVAGSFATDAGTVTLTSNAPWSSLSRGCSGPGLDAVSFKGTATL